MRWPLRIALLSVLAAGCAAPSSRVRTAPAPTDPALPATSWPVVYADSQMTVAVDSASFRTTGPDRYEMVMHIRMLSPGTVNTRRMWERGIRQSVRRVEVDCAKLRYRGGVFVHFTGEGEFVRAVEPDPDGWEDTVPGSRGAAYFAGACGLRP